jgi:heavy metal sensor kinase
VQSVSARLTFKFAVFWVILLGVLALGISLWFWKDLRHEAKRDLESLARSLSERLVDENRPASDLPTPGLRNDLAQFVKANGCRAEVRREDGTAIFDSPELASPAGTLVRESRMTLQGGGRVMVRITIDDRPYRARLYQLLRYFGVIAPVTTILALLFGFVFVRNTLSPIEEVRRKAEQISRANVSERIPEPKTEGEVRDLVRTFNEMLGRLERGIQDLENFAADAAHELRTPLAILRAELETALQENRSAEEDHEVLVSLQEEVARMSAIVTDLFTLAKLDMRQYALKKETFRLVPLLEEVLETWAPLAAERRIILRREGDDARVKGDPNALRRVFMNLVENALKYNREGGEVILAVRRIESKVHVEVNDTGVGISQQHLPGLFRRFYRGDKGRSRDDGGAGLGLAICKSFVEAHEGRIEATSELGQGTHIHVELPVG